MTCDLIDAIKKEFPSNKLFIFSMSWGSILSLLVSEQKTELIDGIVASGQIVKNIFYNEEVYNALKENGISEKTMNKIKDTNINNVKSKDLQLISSLLRKKTNAYNNKKSKTNEVGKIILGLFQSPDYKFKDFKAVIINGYKNNISLWKEILHINLSEKLQKVNTPYFILQGETDIVASTKIVKEICESINNRNLQYKIIAVKKRTLQEGRIKDEKNDNCFFCMLVVAMNSFAEFVISPKLGYSNIFTLEPQEIRINTGSSSGKVMMLHKNSWNNFVISADMGFIGKKGFTFLFNNSVSFLGSINKKASFHSSSYDIDVDLKLKKLKGAYWNGELLLGYTFKQPNVYITLAGGLDPEVFGI